MGKGAERSGQAGSSDSPPAGTRYGGILLEHRNRFALYGDAHLSMTDKDQQAQGQPYSNVPETERDHTSERL